MVDTIVLVLPTIPEYRFHFLSIVNKKLEALNKELILVTGTNVKDKEIKEIKEGLPFEVIKTKTVGIIIFGINLNWQTSLIGSVLSKKPEKVVIMLHTGKINYLILLLILKVRKIPYIVWGSGYRRVDLKSFTLKIKHSIKSVFENWASGYITYSEYFAKKLINNGYDKKRVIVAQNTINIEAILNKRRLQDKKKYDPLYFLFVGALIPEKKLNKAILACKELKQRGYKFRFDIIGGGDILGELQELVVDLNLRDTVYLHGPKYGEDVVSYFEKSNVFLLPGTGGLAVNEAMAYALPIISTPGDGTIYDLVDHKKNGFLLEYDYKIEELISAMEYFINLNKESLKEMEQHSLKKVESKATLHNMANKFVEGLLKFK